MKPAFCRSFLARNSALPPSMMSVPRPAMLVATVTAPNLPAWATISASFSWFFGVQHVVLDAFLIQQPGEQLGLLDGGGTGQDGLALLVAGHDLAR